MALQPLPRLPPHASTPPARAASKAAMPSIANLGRRRAGIQQSSTQTRTALPSAYEGSLRFVELAVVQPPGMAACVEMVRAAVPALTPVMSTVLTEPKLKVGRDTAPDGLLVRAALSVTMPVKPFAGVTMIVAVLPVTAPGAIVTAMPLMEKEGEAGVVKESIVPLVVPTLFCPTAW